MDARARPMVFVTLETGCMVCLSHRLNADGYLRKVWKIDGKRVAEMFHRFIYRAHHGPIPPGWEVDKKGRKLSWLAAKLGGRSERTKALRSMTPTGFARAFAAANP